jgi:hypothetical protein
MIDRRVDRENWYVSRYCGLRLNSIEVAVMLVLRRYARGVGIKYINYLGLNREPGRCFNGFDTAATRYPIPE